MLWPLTPALFHILLALYGRERHGYDIMEQVKEHSRGAVKMGPGTLYGSLDRMIPAGLVTKSDARDPRRIYCKLTALRQATLKAESERLSAVAATARRHFGGDSCPSAPVGVGFRSATRTPDIHRRSRHGSGRYGASKRHHGMCSHFVGCRSSRACSFWLRVWTAPAYSGRRAICCATPPKSR
jgi:DNA-binding MarR family transcriptional regulator